MENQIDSSSTDFDHYVKTNINYVISKTWNLKNTREEIFRSRNLLKGLEDNLFPDHYKNLVLENTKFIFDVMIEDIARWTVKKEILKVFDNCFDNMTEIERYDVSDNLLSRKTYNLYYLYKLIDLLSVYGDYDFQVLIIKIIFRTFQKHDYSITELIPESEDLQNKFLEITMENFDGSLRTFLNGINQRSQNIFSVKCQTIKLGTIECVGNNNGLWIDFNLIDKIASWYINIEALLIEKDDSNDFCSLILLFQRDVEVVTIKRNLCKSIVVTFTLQKSCVSYSEQYQHIIDGAKTLHILLDYSPKAEYLVRTILPTIYRSKFMHKFNKRRKLSLVMNPYVKMPTRTSTNDEFITISSSSNSISDTNSISETILYGQDQIRMRNISDFPASIDKPNILKDRDLNIKIPSRDSEVYIKPKNALLNSDGNNEHDLDEMTFLFESEEQLLSMAREFDAIKSVLSSDIFSTETKKKCMPVVEKACNTSTKRNVFQNSSEKESTGQNKCSTNFNSNRNQNLLSLTNSPIITGTENSVFFRKVTTNIRKVEKAKKRNRHTSVGSITNRDSVKSENIDIPFNCDLSKSKYSSAPKIKSNQLLKSNDNKNDKHKIENFPCTDVSKYKFNRKITERNNKICFQFHNTRLREKLDKIKKDTIHERRENNYDSSTVTGESETSIQQCRAADKEIDSDLSISLFRERKEPKPIADSSVTEDEMYTISEMNGADGKNILNPSVQITPLPSSKNALPISLEDKVVSSTDYKISNTKKIIDTTNIRQDSNHDYSIVVSSAKSENDGVVSDVSISLRRKRKHPKPISDSSAIEDGAVGRNILNPYVKISPLILSKRALTNSLEEISISDYEISNTKNIIDKPNNIFYEEKSVENIDVPYCSKLKTKNLGENLSSNAPVWSKSAILGNTQVKLCSKDFVGKYLFIICYNIDTSTIDPILHSEITQLSENIEDFNNIGAAILICLKGPNIHFSEWRNQFENQEFLQTLKIPLIFDFDGHFISTNFEVYLMNVKSEMKILILVNDRGNVIYKSIFSIFDQVDVVNSLKLLRHVQMRSMMT